MRTLSRVTFRKFVKIGNADAQTFEFPNSNGITAERTPGETILSCGLHSVGIPDSEVVQWTYSIPVELPPPETAIEVAPVTAPKSKPRRT